MLEIVEINNYKEQMGESSSQARKFKEELHALILNTCPDITARTLDTYNLSGERHNLNSGQEGQRVVIFANATTINASEEKYTPEHINGVENKWGEFLQPEGSGKVIMSKEGIILAEWHEEKYELDILFNIFKKYNSTTMHLFKYILDEWNKIVWLPKQYEHSWVHTENKEKLTASVIEVMKRTIEERLAEDKYKLQDFEERCKRYQRELKHMFDNISRLRRTIRTEEENSDAVNKRLVEELNNIANNEKVKDLQIKDGKFIVFTKPLYIHDEKGNRYYGGNYRIEMKVENCEIRFFGDNPRRSYWSTQDPHPHVDGRSGSACLGNIGTTIAELCSRTELYALALVCIDFLESANTDDDAGRNVRNWDMVNENGNMIREGLTRENSTECSECGRTVHRDAIHTVYDSVEEDIDGEEIVVDETEVCEECRNEYYTYDAELSAYIRD